MNKNVKINFDERNITLTSAYAKKAKILGTPENIILLDLLKQFPAYEVKTKAPANRENYTGLTIEFMKKCVLKEYDATSVIKFDEMITLYEKHPAYYGKVKAVFFKDYPKCKALIKNIEIDSEPAETTDDDIFDEPTESNQSNETAL